MTPTTIKHRDQILQSFQEILIQKKQREYQVATKEEEAEKEKNKQLLAIANTYTIDNIVRGLADLQLDFGNIINSLSERLDSEAGKLDQLQRAIAIETQNLQQLQKVRVVADALHLLRQEHQEKLRAIEHEISSKTEALEKEMAQTRKTWQQEQQEFETKIQEAQDLRQKQRQQEEADYTYELERQRKIDADRYEQEKRSLEIKIADQSQCKDKSWAEREQFISQNQARFEDYLTQVSGLEEELKQAYIKAKEEAIQDVTREEKVKADLFDKEWEGSQQGYELKISALEATIQGHNEQIRELSAQLQEATKQAKDLAQMAFHNPVNSGDRTK
jgi:hypothetical protein